jgi:hypothetical protein
MKLEEEIIKAFADNGYVIPSTQTVESFANLVKKQACEFADYIKDNRWQGMPEDLWIKRYSDMPTEAKSSKELLQLFREHKTKGQ